MHELGIAQQMVKTALEYATRHHAARIARINIEMRNEADESEDSLRFHFENLTRGTIAQRAQVEIRRVPVRKKCLACGMEFESGAGQSVCPRCTSVRVRPIPQDEYRLVSIDVE